MALHLRPLNEEEAKTIKKWSSSRTEAARVVQRATIIRLASEGLTVPHIATAMTPPRELGLSFSNWTFERLATYVQEVMGIGMKRTRIFEILQAENGASASKKPASLSESILNSPKSRTRKEA
jgi:hypothetical protein